MSSEAEVLLQQAPPVKQKRPDDRTWTSTKESVLEQLPIEQLKPSQDKELSPSKESILEQSLAEQNECSQDRTLSPTKESDLEQYETDNNRAEKTRNEGCRSDEGETPTVPTNFYSQNAEPIAGPSCENSEANGTSAVTTVASHYNSIEEVGIRERTKSRIFFMRNFNNWIKSMLIGEYLERLKRTMVRGTPLRVLDLGCGKGGDLLKWMRSNASHVVCADVAEISMQHCESRYKEMCNKKHGTPFTAQFITADCTKERLRHCYKNPTTNALDPTLKLHLVSCQFAFHYCFESLPQADCMLQNAAECLDNGGYFIGTIPNAYEIVRRHKAAGTDTFGNDVYKITMKESAKDYPLFGAMYDFHLHDVVDCPEFLVHFPTLVKLAERHGLKLVDKYTFSEFYAKIHEEGRYLLQKINGLELYPPHRDSSLLGKTEDYAHASEYLKKHRDLRSVGTLSAPEWEAASLYMIFAFQKVKKEMSLDDYPEASEVKKKRITSENAEKRKE